MVDYHTMRLGSGDVESALALSTQAGWNQTAADWRRMIELGAVFGEREAGRLVATSSLVSYGGVCWVGMMLVDPAHRGRGLGTAMLEQALARASEATGLDATELGRPLYVKAGFVEVAPIERWSGALEKKHDLPKASLEQVVELDRTCGVDRSKLLRSIPDGWVVPGRGYALIRTGREREHLGPIVADTIDTLRKLLGAAGGRNVVIDAIADPATSNLLSALGLAVQRRLVRMSMRRPQKLLMGPSLCAIAGFEWG